MHEHDHKIPKRIDKYEWIIHVVLVRRKRNWMKRLYNLPKLHSFTFLYSWFYWKSFVIFFLSCLFTIHLTLLTDEGEVVKKSREIQPQKREIALSIYIRFPELSWTCLCLLSFSSSSSMNIKKKLNPLLDSEIIAENQTNIKFQRERSIIGNKTLECERSAIQNMMKQFYATLHKCPFRLQWFPPEKKALKI